MERHTMKLDGERYDTVYLLRVIADQLEQSYINPVPQPLEGCNPTTPTPTRFSIHWETIGGGEWLGYLVAHTELECKAHNKTHTYNTPILRILVTMSGAFHAKCILEPHHTLITSSTYVNCKEQIEHMVLSPHMLDQLYPLCVKEDYNSVKTE